MSDLTPEQETLKAELVQQLAGIYILSEASRKVFEFMPANIARQNLLMLKAWINNVGPRLEPFIKDGETVEGLHERLADLNTHFDDALAELDKEETNGVNDSSSS